MGPRVYTLGGTYALLGPAVYRYATASLEHTPQATVLLHAQLTVTQLYIHHKSKLHS